MVVLSPIQDVSAQDQEPVIETFEDDPADRLGTVRGVTVLLERTEGDHVTLGGLPVGQRRILLDEARRTLGGIGVTSQALENVVSGRRVPRLGEAKRLRVALPALKVDNEEDEDHDQENRRDCDSPPLDGYPVWVRACHLSHVRPSKPDPS